MVEWLKLKHYAQFTEEKLKQALKYLRGRNCEIAQEKQAANLAITRPMTSVITVLPPL